MGILVFMATDFGPVYGRLTGSIYDARLALTDSLFFSEPCVLAPGASIGGWSPQTGFSAEFNSLFTLPPVTTQNAYYYPQMGGTVQGPLYTGGALMAPIRA